MERLEPPHRLHPGVVFAGLVGALMISGFLGALVVVPLIATGKLVGNYVHRKMLGLPPWPDAETPHAAADAPLTGARGEAEDVDGEARTWTAPDPVEAGVTSDE